MNFSISALVAELAVVFVATALFIRLITRYAKELHLIDRPNFRSSHSVPTPRGAGIAFVTVPLLSLYLFHSSEIDDIFPLFISFALILFIGILDDRHESSPKMKFIVIAVSTIILWCFDIRIDRVGHYFGTDISMGILSLPFTYFALAGFTNAFNLIDGIDGLAGSMAVVILSFFAILGYLHEDNALFYISTFLITAILAFLLFNWYPASIFMGDSGSLTLGFIISVLFVLSLDYIPSVSVLYLGAVPIIDTIVAMIRRKKRGISMVSPDRCHLHHILLRILGTVPIVVVAMVILQSLYSISGVVLVSASNQTSSLVLFLAGILIFYIIVLKLKKIYSIECYDGKSENG
jgi:UDP-GlcNAc:undecaprenyl-phosphate GlcNAc-1-phosphate transferase